MYNIVEVLLSLETTYLHILWCEKLDKNLEILFFVVMGLDTNEPVHWASSFKLTFGVCELFDFIDLFL